MCALYFADSGLTLAGLFLCVLYGIVFRLMAASADQCSGVLFANGVGCR